MGRADSYSPPLLQPNHPKSDRLLGEHEPFHYRGVARNASPLVSKVDMVKILLLMIV
jgi:hypothetical protein